MEGDINDFKVLETGFDKDFDRKIAESLFVKQHDPILNKQKVSYKLALFN